MVTEGSFNKITEKAYIEWFFEVGALWLLACEIILFNLIEKPIVYEEPINPCVPTPCGPNSQCRSQNNAAVCSCFPNYIGRAPNCRPECMVSSDCTSSLACINQKCKNPCEGSCGLNTECKVSSHIPLCTCRQGYVGEPFNGCKEKTQCKNAFRRSPLNLNISSMLQMCL